MSKLSIFFSDSFDLLHTDEPRGGFVGTWVGMTQDLFQPVFTTT